MLNDTNLQHKKKLKIQNEKESTNFLNVFNQFFIL